ncbi:MAG: PTS system mannose/fructose/sorbose family transporter subunit IID [Sedimentibacter sp.]
MTILNYFLLSVLYFWGSSTALSLGIGYYSLYRPIISGMVTGLILGNVFLGMLTGAVVNLIYIDFVSTGGSFKGDQCLTAIIGATCAILFDLSPIEAAAIAYPFGFLGIFIWKYRLNINSIFVKKYEKAYDANSDPNISLYDGLFPQLLLYAMSTVVIVAELYTLLFFNEIALNYYLNIKDFLYLAGLFLIFVSSWNILYSIKNKYNIMIFISVLLVTLFLNPRSYLFFIIFAIILLVISNKDIFRSNKKRVNMNGNISKGDLIYSWFIWMNFSHSCYSYNRLQGMAFAHSMKNIFKKLYKDSFDVSNAVHRHTEFFNTEPNIGTPIHGYIISLEEQITNNKNELSNVAYIKTGMMGIAAGLGDSFTQVVLTPLFISLSIMMCLDHSCLLALLPVLLLACSILFISYSGWMKGYYEGKESLIDRVNMVKNSKVKFYFPYIFPAILGVSLGKLIYLDYEAFCKDAMLSGAVLLISIIYTLAKNKRR